MDQLNLLGLDTEPPPFQPDQPDTGDRAAGYSLFLAIVPGPEVEPLIAPRVVDLRRRHGLNGKIIGADRLHISLHGVAAFRDTLSRRILDAAMAASASVDWPSIPVVFDHAGSFPNAGMSGKRPFVLQCDAGSAAAIRRLRQSLQQALRGVGLHPLPSSTPHMTLLYDRAVAPLHPIEPIRWTATRFALILSHIKLGHHQWLGQWNLRDRA